MLCAVIPRTLRSIAVLALVGLLAACSTPSPKAAATVDGVEISDQSLEDLLPAVRYLAGGQGGPCDVVPEGTDPEAPLPESSADCSRFVLGLMVQAAAVESYAEENDLIPTSTDINDALNQVQSSMGDATAMREALAKDGGSLDDMRELVRVILTLQAVQQHVATNLSEEDLRALYEQQKDQFATLDTAHILVDDQQQAQEIKDQATTENFAELAKKFSKDPGSGQKGGNLGPIPASGLVPQYSEAVLAAEPGTIIGPVQSEFGWHVIWVKDVSTPPFEEVKDQLQGAGGQAFEPWLTDRLTQADVQVNPKYGTFNAQTGQIDAPAGQAEPPAEQAPGAPAEPPAGEPAPAP